MSTATILFNGGVWSVEVEFNPGSLEYEARRASGVRVDVRVLELTESSSEQSG